MPSHNPELSIIILSFNTKKITADCLTSIFTNPPDHAFEIIVLDNASRDGSGAMLKKMQKKHTELKVILNTENTGFSKGNNQAAANAHGAYLLFLNSDTLVSKNALSKLLKTAQSSPHHWAIFGPTLLNADGSRQPSAGPFYSLPFAFAWLFLKGDSWGATRSSPSRQTYTDWVSGACFLIKKPVFDSLGGFDDNIFMYMEEVDLCYRALKAGYRTVFTPQAIITHFGSASSGKTYPVLQVYRGLLYFYRKHYPIWQLYVLQYILRIKAASGVIIGTLLGNSYLKKTYAEAYRITQQN